MLRLLCYCSLLLWCAIVVVSFPSECIVRDPCASASAPYYWKDYVGIIPDDAIEGGRDVDGNTTYIGQILSPTTNGILPAVIYPGKHEAVSTAALHRFADSKYIKILCSAEKQKFEWKETHVKNLHLLKDYHLVIGGTETGQPLYVGRSYFEGELMVGKVFGDDYWARGLRLPMNDGSEFGTLNFEILVYPRQCNRTTTPTPTTTTTPTTAPTPTTTATPTPTPTQSNSISKNITLETEPSTQSTTT